MPQVIYLYAIAPRGALQAPDVEGVDGRRDFAVVEEGEIAALAGRVDAAEFSQEAIDARASDLDWIGQIGWRHQQVVAAARDQADAIPLGAFSLFSSEEALRGHLSDRQAALREVLDAIREREEWTLQVDFQGDRWEAAVARRSPTLAALAVEQVEQHPPAAALADPLDQSFQDLLTRMDAHSPLLFTTPLWKGAARPPGRVKTRRTCTHAATSCVESIQNIPKRRFVAQGGEAWGATVG